MQLLWVGWGIMEAPFLELHGFEDDLEVVF
jgi:hypothetical protein